MGIDILPGAVALSKFFCLTSEKQSTLEGKNLLPVGADYFLKEYTLFRKGVDVQGIKQEVIKLSHLKTMGGKSPKRGQSCRLASNNTKQ